MTAADKIAWALSVIDYPKYKVWAEKHGYSLDLHSRDEFKRNKILCDRLLKLFTVDELRQLFMLAHDYDV